MKLKFLEAKDIEAVPPKERPTILLGYRRRIFDEVHQNASYIIFQRRIDIAVLFRNASREAPPAVQRQLEETAALFENLTDAEDLLQNTPKPSEHVTKQPEKVGYIIYDDDQFDYKNADETAVRLNVAQRNPGAKIAKRQSKVTTWLDLFKIVNRQTDRRAIYIACPLTDQLQQQLNLLITMYPDVAERLFYLDRSSDQPTAIPFSRIIGNDCTSLQTTAGRTLDPEAVNDLKNFLTYKPKVGDVLDGVITKVADFGVFVMILPGRESFVHKSDLPHNQTFSKGDPLRIKIYDIDDRTDRIKATTILYENEDCPEKQTQPVFPFTAVHKKLLKA